METDPLEFVPLLLGAGSSVDLVIGDIFTTNWVDTTEAAPLVDERLRRRCLVPDPDLWLVPPDVAEPGRKDHLGRRIVNRIRKNGWDVRELPFKPTLNCLVVDDETVYFPGLSNDQRRGSHLHISHSAVSGLKPICRPSI